MDTHITDFALPFHIDQSDIRGRWVELSDSLTNIVHKHAYPKIVADLLAETILIGALLSSLLKFKGLFTLQVRGDGAIKLLVVDLTSDGDLRANAQFDPDRLEGTDFKNLLGQGYLAFTVDQGPDMQPYQGIVQLMGHSLKDCILHYFDQSEQIPTALQMGICEENGRYLGRALLLQSLPELKRNASGEEDWCTAMVMLASLKQNELLDFSLSPENILFRLFHEQGARLHEVQPYQAKCRCSHKKMLRALKTIPYDDLVDERQDNKLETICEFCNQSYHFTLDDLKGDSE